MRRLKRLGQAAVLLVAGASLAWAGEPRAVKKVAPDKVAARQAFDFSYEDINPASPSFGKKLALADLYSKQGVVLNFLASWCPPCWHEVPALSRMASDVETPVVCVAADEHGPPTDLLNMAARAKLKLPIVLVPRDKIEEMEAHYDHGILPTTYWIDKRGRVVERRQGQLSESALFATTRKNLPTGPR